MQNAGVERESGLDASNLKILHMWPLGSRQNHIDVVQSLGTGARVVWVGLEAG